MLIHLIESGWDLFPDAVDFALIGLLSGRRGETVESSDTTIKDGVAQSEKEKDPKDY